MLFHRDINHENTKSRASDGFEITVNERVEITPWREDQDEEEGGRKKGRRNADGKVTPFDPFPRPQLTTPLPPTLEQGPLITTPVMAPIKVPWKTNNYLARAELDTQSHALDRSGQRGAQTHRTVLRTPQKTRYAKALPRTEMVHALLLEERRKHFGVLSPLLSTSCSGSDWRSQGCFHDASDSLARIVHHYRE
ncbi:hypothetical protein E2C01_022350 [Portunus trituberculatus]|uniref:Uncharacterized protein n=1 Tax=Portunus trituberculatus TaxID=210409 RepID=A0A5B7E547_PORTR|nr:hypothetical protein [Portunus trituberculatus]